MLEEQTWRMGHKTDEELSDFRVGAAEQVLAYRRFLKDPQTFERAARSRDDGELYSWTCWLLEMQTGGVPGWDEWGEALLEIASTEWRGRKAYRKQLEGLRVTPN